MHLPRFRLLQPKSIEHAAELLAQSETAIIMAGGTDVLPRMKYGLELPESVIGLSNLPVQEPVDFDGISPVGQPYDSSRGDARQNHSAERACAGRGGPCRRFISDPKHGNSGR